MSLQRASLLSLLFAAVSIASSTVSASTSTPMQRVVDSLVRITSGGQFRYQRSDAYRRLIEIRAMQILGTFHPHGSSIGKGIPPSTLAKTSNLTKSPATPEAETSVAISRTNGDIIVGGANDLQMYGSGMPAYYSQNHGATWATVRVPSPSNEYFCLGDPILSAAPDGSIYYAYLIGVPSMSPAGFTSDVMLARTTNGATWQIASPVLGPDTSSLFFQDKEALVIDANISSPHFGRLYATWMSFAEQAQGSYLMIAYSDDQGTSWTRRRISEGYWNFSNIRIGVKGEIYVVASDGETPGGPITHMLFTSKDGAENFTAKQISQAVNYPQVGLRPGLKSSSASGFRAYPYVSFDVDQMNVLHVVVSTYESSARDAALFYYSSADGGATWSQPQRIGSDKLDRFMPWVSYDPMRNRTFVTYYSSAEDSKNKLVRVERTELLTSSLGATVQIGDGLFDPTKCELQPGEAMMGDYIGSDFANGTYAAVWTENPKGTIDVDVYAYVSTITETGETPVVKVKPTKINASFRIAEITPNPARGSSIVMTVEGKTSGRAKLRIIAAHGAVLVERDVQIDESGKIELPLGDLAQGSYTVTLEADGETATGKFVR